MTSPSHDLVMTRETDVPRAVLWKGWTEPQYLVRWFSPAPWRTVEAHVDLRAGGRFHTVMRGPDGQGHDSSGCYLQIVPERRLVWTSVLEAEFRPQAAPFLPFTAVLSFEDSGGGTRFMARLLHATAEDADRHAAMGFETGWAKAFEQLVALAPEIS
jgi:uncharacterized protein YndB with AHSA1/START domain